MLPALALAALPVLAQVTGDPDAVLAAMQAQGYTASLGEDDGGDPVINGKIDGTEYTVFFFGCDPKPCQSLKFSAGFDMADGLALVPVNDWNRDRRYGKVFLDSDGDPYIEMDVNLAGDGVGTENFGESLNLWRAVLSGFREHIKW